jgi:hypothetical protein
MLWKRCFAAFAALWLALAPALADQSPLYAPTTGSLPGLTMVNDYNSALNALATCNSGAAAPTNQLSGTPSQGDCWYNTSTGAVQYYDGTYWLLVGYIDATNHVWTPVLGGNAATSVASASTTNLCGGSALGSYLSITGTASIASFGTNCWVGQIKIVTFTGVATLTYNSGSMILPTAANITTAAGDVAIAVYLGSGNWKVIAYLPASGAPLVAASYVAPPTGRLTLVSATPFMSAAQTGISTVYYTPTPNGNQMPSYNGTVWAPTPFSEISQALSDTTHSPAAAVANAEYDYFVCQYGGSFVLERGPAWTNSTTRSLSLTRASNGLLTNASAIQNASSTTICAAGYGVFVGTIATDVSAAAVTFAPTPAAASSGPTTGSSGGNPGAWVGLWNEYNRVPVFAAAKDSKSSWTNSASTWGQSDGSGNNRLTHVVGWQEDSVDISFMQAILVAQGLQASTGILVDSTSTSSPPIAAFGEGPTSGIVNGQTQTSRLVTQPASGLHYYQAMEWSNSASTTFYGNVPTANGQAHQISAQLRY